MHACVRVHACLRACARVLACVRACVFVCVLACVRVCLCALMHACVLARFSWCPSVRVSVRVCVHSCVHAFLHWCVCMHAVLACVRACLRACLGVRPSVCACIRVCMRTCIGVCACMHALCVCVCVCAIVYVRSRGCVFSLLGCQRGANWLCKYHHQLYRLALQYIAIICWNNKHQLYKRLAMHCSTNFPRPVCRVTAYTYFSLPSPYPLSFQPFTPLPSLHPRPRAHLHRLWQPGAGLPREADAAVPHGHRRHRRARHHPARMGRPGRGRQGESAQRGAFWGEPNE